MIDSILSHMAWISREIEKQRRIIVCHAEDQHRVQEALDLTPYAALHTVQASALVPKGTMYLIDPNQMHVAISMPSDDRLMADQRYQDIWKKMLVDYYGMANEGRELKILDVTSDDVVGTCSGCNWVMTSYGTHDPTAVEAAFPLHDCRSYRPQTRTTLISETVDNHVEARCDACRWTAEGGGDEIIQRMFEDHRCEDFQGEESA